MIKRKMLALLAVLLSLCLLTGCVMLPNPFVSDTKDSFDDAEASPDVCRQFDALLDDIFLNEISQDTLTLHFSVMDPAQFHLEDMSPCWSSPEENDRYPTEKLESALSAYNPGDLTEDRRITREILLGYCRYAEEMSAEEYRYFSTYLDMNNGVHTSIPVNLAEYEFYREKDVTDFLALLDSLPEYMQEIIDWEKERVEAGYGPSDAVLNEIIDKCGEILADGENFYLTDVFAERIDAADFLDFAKKSEYKEREKRLIAGDFMDAFRALKTALESFLGKGKQTGLAGYPNGAAYYQLYADYVTGTDLTCPEMIQKLESDYQSIIRQLAVCYMTHPDVADDYETGKGVIPLTDAGQILDYLRPKMEGIFPEISGDRYEIRYLPKSMEKVMDGVLAYYTIPQVDNYLTGRITINGGAGDLSDLYNTVAHEGYPGHMYQHIYFYSQNPSNIRKILSCTGYSEGWAYYAADYAYTLYDFAEGSAMATLYRLDNNLAWNLSCRMEIGVHYEGWTVEQLADYLSQMGMMPSAAQEIYDSVLGSPGGMLPYYMGYLEFADLQAQAKQELGGDYNPIEFHEAVLSVGSCPFPYVEQSVKAYIAGKK